VKKDKKDSEKFVADNRSRILYDRESESSVSEYFSDGKLYLVHPNPSYADILNYLVIGGIPEGWTKNDRDKFFHLMKLFVWDDPYLFKYCSDQVFRTCIFDHEVKSVLFSCRDQTYGEHFSGQKTAAKVLQYGFY